MPDTSTSFRTRRKIQLREPMKYEVIFHNDDFTPMDLVVDLLIHIFKKDEAEAERLMLAVHHQGKAVVGTYTLDIARSKADKAINIARSEGYPLKITVEPTDGLPF